MAEIVNLRLARKAKARDRAAREAEANRAAHGRTKGQKAAAQAERKRLTRAVEGARLEKGGD